MDIDMNDLNAVCWPVQLTGKLRRDIYPAVDPSRPELSAKGSKVLITGVSGVIGKAIAEAWTTAGADAVVITARRVEILNEVAEKLRKSSPSTKVVVQPADVTSEDSVKALFAKIKEEVGSVNVLINNHGSLQLGVTGEQDPSTWWKDYETNVKGTYITFYYFNQQISDGTTGTLVNVNSGASKPVIPTMGSYSSAKLAQIKMTEFIHAECPKIRAFSLLPGNVLTDMTAPMFKHMALDDPLLTGGLTLYAHSTKGEWLRGSILSINWDVDEMEEHKEEILREGRNKLQFVNAKLQKGGHPWEK